MKKLLAVLTLLLLTSAARGGIPVPPGARILVLGDSITYGGTYVSDLECWLLQQGWTGTVINVGLPSETGCDLTESENEPHKTRHGFPRPALSERLDRVLAAAKPDLILACYGMNDASTPNDDSRFARFQAGIERIRTAAAAAGVKQVIHLTPPAQDDGPGKPVGPHDLALERFTRWLLEQRSKGWTVIDLHGPMRASLEAERAKNPAFRYCGDGIHPNDAGHLLMARQVIAAWGGPADYTPAPALFKAVHARMIILRDAWLRETRHTRPGLAAGLPLPQAEAKAAALQPAIAAALATKP